jgi:zinc protease
MGERIQPWRIALAVLVVGACGGTPGSTTVTTPVASSTAITGPTTPTTRPPAVTPTYGDDADVIPLDPATRVGVLDNGLRFYIRENAAPGGRAQLRLVVKAGSAHESDEQKGVAHYLEHMMFNGTQRYPANELVQVLQRFGAEFGPDINAYTSYEETVYMLELPTDDPDTVATGFDVLREWATAATIDPAEVDLERGVLVEEWRLRDQGFWGRYFAEVTDLLLAGTPYDGRLPLAAPADVEATTPEALRSFYTDWYRPDLMAVVAVGDFDADDIEALIRDGFAGISGPVDAPAVPELFTNAFSAPQFLIMADPEASDAFVELNYPVPAEGVGGTIGALRRRIALDAALDMLATRLHEDTLRGVTPYFDPSRAANEFVRTQGTDGIAATAHPEDLEATAAALLAEVERVRRFGFVAGELDRTVAELRSEVESEYEQRTTKQDAHFAAELVENFLGGSPAADAEEWRDLQLRLIDELTLDQVWATFAATIEATAPLVIVAGPEASVDVMPDTATLAAIHDRLPALALEARPDDTVAVTALMEAPEPAGVAERYTLPETVIPVVELENGLWFVAWPTEIHAGHAELIAGSPGGWVTLAAADVTEARLLSDVVLASGVADFDQVTLERALVGTEVTLQPFVDEVWEGFRGGVDTADLEILFQLIHLYMDQPRFDPVAIPIVQNRLQQQVESPETLVDTALALSIAAARFPGDDRFSPLPSPGELDALDLARVEAVFADRFGDPGDFVFVLVGDFDPDAAETLARRYLGTIEGGEFREDFEDDRPPEPDGIVTETVAAGTGERGVFTMRFESTGALDPDLRVHLDILEAVIEQRLITHIREELSASYSPTVSIDAVDEPVSAVEVAVRIDGDPNGVEAVRTALLEDLEDLTTSGPTADEFDIAREQVYRDYELIDNIQLARAMLHAIFYPEDLVTEIIDRFDRVTATTRADILAAAQRVITLDEYIEIALVPIGFGE